MKQKNNSIGHDPSEKYSHFLKKFLNTERAVTSGGGGSPSILEPDLDLFGLDDCQDGALAQQLMPAREGGLGALGVHPLQRIHLLRRVPHVLVRRCSCSEEFDPQLASRPRSASLLAPPRAARPLDLRRMEGKGGAPPCDPLLPLEEARRRFCSWSSASSQSKSAATASARRASRGRSRAIVIVVHDGGRAPGSEEKGGEARRHVIHCCRSRRPTAASARGRRRASARRASRGRRTRSHPLLLPFKGAAMMFKARPVTLEVAAEGRSVLGGLFGEGEGDASAHTGICGRRR
jgi:hypothetical protein